MVKKATFSNLDKVFWPEEGITKGELINYYKKIAPFILPFLKDRPESLRRFPDGIQGEGFFQKNLIHYPEWISTIRIESENKSVNYLLIQNVESLLFAVNLGCIEIHPFFSRYQSLEFPDFLALDLDPEDIPFEKVVEVARTLHETLEACEIPSYCKTSGGRGMHICIPLKGKYTYDQAEHLAHLLALITHQKIPDFTSLERSPKKRQNKVYIDYLQNRPHQTLAAPYSVRARPHAPISMPLEWSEVKKGLNPLDFTIRNSFERIESIAKSYKPLLTKGIQLPKVLAKLEKYIKIPA